MIYEIVLSASKTSQQIMGSDWFLFVHAFCIANILTTLHMKILS